MPISPSNRLWRASDRRIGARLPIPISARLDVLVAIGNDAWAPTTRKEALSALLLALPTRARQLRTTLERYRTATVADAIVAPWPAWRFLYPPDSPGPRVQLSLFEDAEPPDEPPPCSRDELLAKTADYRIGLEIPEPLVTRVDLVVKIANAAELETTRQELVAAAILAAPAEPTWLARRLHTYWHARIADAARPDLPLHLIVDPPRGPKRPKRSPAPPARPQAAGWSRHRVAAPDQDLVRQIREAER